MTPTPSAQEWLKEAALQLNRLILAAFTQGAQAEDFSDEFERIKDTDIDRLEAALLAHLAARPQEQPKPNTEAAHLMAPVGKDLLPALSEDTRDAERLDYLQRTGSTIDLPSAGQGLFRFRVGGLHAAVHHDLRAAIDAAMENGNA